MANIKRLDGGGTGGRYVQVSNTARDKRDAIARDNALKRPQSEREFAKRPDRVGKYFKKYMKDFVFDNFTDAYLKKSGLTEFSGVPIPLRKEDLEQFKSEKGLSPQILAENMARVIGIDPRFPHADAYISFILMLLGPKCNTFILKVARRESAKGEFDSGCIHFRAALMINPTELGAMYGYARTCRALYNSENASEEYVGNFKAESFEYFEMLTEIHPKYAQGWYYLGYQYLNMGLYTKAHIAWETFYDRSNNRKDRKEIKQRLEQIQQPMEIEKGCNSVMAGRWQEGLAVLEPFMSSVYEDWWPMWYYLGMAYANLERLNDAEISFKRALTLNASHRESMEELIEIYRATGNSEMIKKYENKLKLIK